GGVGRARAEAVELGPYGGVMPGENVAPRSVAELDCPFGRVDEVGEENGRQHRLRPWFLPDLAHESLDLVGEGLRGPGRLVRSVELDAAGVGNAFLEVRVVVGGRVLMQYQRGDADRREDVANVDIHCHPVHGERGGGACPVAHDVYEPASELGVVRHRRIAVAEDRIEILLGPPTPFDLAAYR